ncbi:MAG: Gfo/Idh/MocA family oxidoreductase [Gammaproteobacteria bacterium]
MPKIKTAVVGAGYLGRFHAEKYARLADSDLRAVVDIDAERASAIAAEHDTEALTDYRGLLGKVDAVSIVVPTSLHFDIASAFLEHGTHVLVEKPVTTTVEQAEELIELARRGQRVLQVGHLERFNAAMLNLDRYLTRPVFIESHRLAPFKPRGTDVSVLLDLMIHDIDIILNVVRSDLESIDASGAAVLSNAIDIANARLVFASGCVANVTASRISAKTERKMRVFQEDAYLSVDLHQRVLSVSRKTDGEMFPGVPNIETTREEFEDSDALKTEIESFLQAVRTGSDPLVSGEDGKRALQTATEIGRLVGGSGI